VDFLVRLATKIPQVKFVKDSSANIAQMNTLLDDHADAITFLNGEDILLLPALIMKAPGMVMGIANFMAPALAKLYKAGQEDDAATAVAIWRQINPVIRILGNGSYNSGVKAACEILGLPVGGVRAPISPYSTTQVEKLRQALSKIDPILLTGARQ
jgi:4-hydroxy-tetrahydrodipicolinate synthase